MIELALETPKALLEELTPLCDFSFCLAQEVLADGEYAKFYKREKGSDRLVIMDNGFHELGRPLSIPELVEAASRINPTYVVAPDMIDDLPWTYKQWKKCETAFENREALGIFDTVPIPVLVEGPELDQKSFLMNIQPKVLCLPFRRNRLEWFRFHRDTLKQVEHIHLLGVSTIDELRYWADYSERYGFMCTVDTSKPVKWGLLGSRMDQVPSIRHAPIHSSKIASIGHVQEMQRGTIYWNVAYLRRFLG